MTRQPSVAVRSNRHVLLRPVYIAVATTVVAEAAYFVVWGLVLFPQGSIAGKLTWTLTCDIAMGATIGVVTIVLVGERFSAAASMAVAAATMMLVGSYCAFLCSRIDAQFDYFGGPDNSALLILGGVVPAVLGGLLYGWLLYAPFGTRIARQLGFWTEKNADQRMPSNNRGTYQTVQTSGK